MKILAIDTSLAATACCIWDTELEQAVSDEALPMLRGHAEALMPLIKRVAEKLPSGLNCAGRVAVTVGPGSFTGLRIGISAARAIAKVLNIPVAGVSTLSAIAAPAVLANSVFDVVSIIDARHGNAFFQVTTGAGKMLVPAQKSSFDAVAEQLSGRTAQVFGNIDSQAMEFLAKKSVRAKLRFHHVSAPDITSVARLGAIADPVSAPARPLYLSAADAKPSIFKPSLVEPSLVEPARDAVQA